MQQLAAFSQSAERRREERCAPTVAEQERTAAAATDAPGQPVAAGGR